MDNTTHKQINKKWLIGAIVYALAFLFVLMIANLNMVNEWLGKALLVLRPVLIGLVLAYFCNPLFRLFERNLFFKVRPIRLRRVLSLIFTYLIVFLILLFFLLLLIPQLVSSISNFVESYDVYMDKLIGYANEVIVSLNNRFSGSGSEIPLLNAEGIKTSISDFFVSIDNDTIMEWVQSIDIVFVGELLQNVFSILTDIIFGFFISLYLLNSKEKRYAQIMRMRKALFSDSVNERITDICTITNRSFGGFFRGKLLDSFIIAILVYIAIWLYGIEYPLLIATIIGITDIVPIIGPIIGVFPAGLIILLSQPEKLIPFIIIIILVQQLDGNIISPKILGENTGVSSLCVIIAIATMGTLWGFAGMVMGVPLFATILELSDRFLEQKLKAKGRPSDTEQYYQDISAAKSPRKRKRSTWFARYQKKMLRLKQENFTDGGIGDLTKFEKLQLQTYSMACKFNIFSDFSEESLEQFAAAESAIAATVETEKKDEATPAVVESN